MPAVTVRNLSDDVHARVRNRADAAGMSMEAFIRHILAEAAHASTEHDTAPPAGFAEAAAVFTHAVGGQPPVLWGALRGSVSVAPDFDLTTPTGEIWSAES